MISDNENVARILRPEWVVCGILQHYAFVLRRNETYISVNRPAVFSFKDDVRNFVNAHAGYYADKGMNSYFCAMLNVGEVRQAKVVINGLPLQIEVEVEPRDMFTKSHAGIFTRYDGKIIKTGDAVLIKNQKAEVSSDGVLLEVRYHLLKLAKLESCPLL